jgi:hypothetical protein
MIFPQQTSNLRESELRFVEALRKEFQGTGEKLLEEKAGSTNRKTYRSVDVFQGVQLDPKPWEKQLKIDYGYSLENGRTELSTPVNVK